MSRSDLSPAPVPGHERAVLLDVLRGCALCGVLVANTVVAFDGQGFLPLTSSGAWLDDSIPGLIWRIFLADKAMTTLTFLFGLGFSIQLARAEQRGHGVAATYLRRLAVLFAIGACHVTFLWNGDILWVYAVSGLLLLPCRRLGDRTVLGLALALVLLPRVLTLVPAIGDLIVSDRKQEALLDAEMLTVMHGSSYLDTISIHVRVAIHHHLHNLTWILPWFLGRFLFGLYAGRRGLFENNGADHLPLFRKLALAGGALLVTHATVVIATFNYDLELWFRFITRSISQTAIIGTAALYISAVVLLVQRPRWRRLLSIVAPVGRMPLTTYLSQSVICTFLFYGWGLGLAGLGPWSGVLVLGVFALQIAASTLWLRYFRLGPMEWVWRTLVYRQRQPMWRGMTTPWAV